MTHWIVVGSEENLLIAKARNFDMFGFKSTRRKGSGDMRPGDKLVFYLVGIMKFGGIVTVESETYEDHTPVFKSEKKPGEDYPFRVKTTPDVILAPGQYLDVKEIAARLDFTKSRGEHWRLAFQGNLHKISDGDYGVIEQEMGSAAPAGTRQ